MTGPRTDPRKPEDDKATGTAKPASAPAPEALTHLTGVPGDPPELEDEIAEIKDERPPLSKADKLALSGPRPAPAPKGPPVRRVNATLGTYYISELGLTVEPGDEFESSLALSDALFPKVKE